MEKLYKQSEVSGTKLKALFKADEFLIARLKLTFFYSLTAIIILGGSSIILYKTLLSNLTESIHENIIDLGVARAIIDKTQDILQNRFLVVDSIIVFFVIIVGFLLTQKTLKPIKKSMDAQKRFIADASHELRTPVTIAISGIEVALRNKNLDFATARKTLENTLVEMKEFSTLSNTLLDISKYTADRNIEYVPIIITDLIQRVASKMKLIASDTGVVIQTDLQPLARITGNVLELERVFYNILDNAIAHTPPGGAITIYDSISSGTYTVVITDTGSGIPKNVLDKIFDPFFRGDKSRTLQGAGLGLTITKKIIENHSGTITAKSELGKGTIVSVSFPISSQ